MTENDTALTGSARWWVLGTIGVGTFMSALDGSVVNTLLPILSHALNTSVAGIEWVTTVYLLVISALLLSVGETAWRFREPKGVPPSAQSRYSTTLHPASRG